MADELTTVNVAVTVRYTVPQSVSDEIVSYYPVEIFRPGMTVEQKACAMAEYDCRLGDEPMDVYADDSEFVSAEVIT